MKKLNKILLGGLICATSFIFMGNTKALVEADRLGELAINGKAEYQVYENGSDIYYDKLNHLECNSISNMCKVYTVSEDDGINDSQIKLSNSEEDIYVSKNILASGYVISANKNIEIFLPAEKDYEKLLDDIENVTNIKYFKKTDNIVDIIGNSNNHDNIYLDWNNDLKDEKILIPEGVTVTTVGIELDELNNKGTLKTQYLKANKVYGNGTINFVSFKIDEEDTEMGDGPNEAVNFEVKDITGVSVKITNREIEDGMMFGAPGPVSKYSKEEAQKVIDMYNKVLDSSINDYELQLTTFDDSFSDEGSYYGGVFRKKAKIKTTTKQDTKSDAQEEIKNNEVKNPSTGDAIILTIAALITSGAVFIVTYKKAKQK